MDNKIALNFLFKKIKNDYPNFEEPTDGTLAEWGLACDGLSRDELLNRLKEHKKVAAYNHPPNIQTFLPQKETCSESREVYVCPELELYHSSRLEMPFGRFCGLFRRMIDDYKAQNPEARNLTFATGLMKSMQLNGWWTDKIREYIQNEKV